MTAGTWNGASIFFAECNTCEPAKDWKIGGSEWESNPTRDLLQPHTGFEDQRHHQAPFTPVNKLSKKLFAGKPFCSIIFFAIDDVVWRDKTTLIDGREQIQ